MFVKDILIYKYPLMKTIDLRYKKTVCFISLILFINLCFGQNTESKHYRYTNLRIRKLNKEGADFRSKAKFDKAILLHYKALNLAESIKDTISIISSLNKIGTILRRTGSYYESTHYHFLASKMAKNNSKYYKSRAIALNGLGNAYLSLGKFKEAKRSFKTALDLERKVKSSLGQAIDLCNIADTYSILNERDSAKYYYIKSLYYNNKISSNMGISICKRSLGILLLKERNSISDGIKLMQESLDLINDSEDLYHKIEIKTSIAEAYLSLGMLAETDKLIKEIEIDLSSVKSLELCYIIHILKSKFYKKQNKTDKAYNNLYKAYKYKDSMQILNNGVRIIDMRKRYQMYEANNKLISLENEKRIIKDSKQVQLWLFSALIICLILLLIFVYLRNRSKAQLNRELKEISKMKTKFFNNISHELRTPVTLISSTLDMIDSNTDKELKESYLDIAKRNSNRLGLLINQLLTLSKINISGFNLQISKINISEEIKHLAEDFVQYAQSRKIDLEYHFEDSNLVWGDTYLIDILINNLINNSIKHSKEGDSIILNGNYNNGKYIFSTKNRYRNSNLVNLDKLFERYFTNEVRNNESFGIGLSLVKEICNLYGAKISVKLLDKNNIIEFSLELPTNKDSFNKSTIHETHIIENKIDKQVIIDSKSTDKPLVLIVEDNRDMNQFLSSVLQSDYRILNAYNGEDGLELAINEIPDLIISDMMMPKMDGHDLLKEVRNNIETSHIPLIILTAAANREVEIESLNAKADDYITKPFDVKVLLAKIKNLLKMRELLQDKYSENIFSSKHYKSSKKEDPFNNTLKEIISGPIFSDSFDIESFCEYVGMSKSQLYRKMKAISGISPKEFIIKHRINKACILLKDSNYTVSEIAFMCGFQSHSYFSRIFKNNMNLSPKDYRENNNV
ncbi:response regulator [Marinilabiliaceae bacterium JC040]|nr:response regulator [Marinilabiliaceae bacterium JC040]